mgnify:CR=1 FL=1
MGCIVGKSLQDIVHLGGGYHTNFFLIFVFTVNLIGKKSADARKEGRKALLAFAPPDQEGPSKEEENVELHEPDQDSETGLQDTGFMSETTLVWHMSLLS